MNIHTLIQSATHTLKECGNPSPLIDSKILLCHVLQCEPVFLHTHKNDSVSPGHIELFQALLRLRQQGIPLQHITQTQEFMSLPFFVNSQVLIPRQDTETLVEAALLKLNRHQTPIEVLELGTGSGCISISLAKNLKEAHFTAVDISKDALAVAQKNANFHTVSHLISFIESNLFEKVGPRVFDAIVSNPPYIATSEIPSLMPEVRHHEPLLALDGGEDGLHFYRMIIKYAPRYLKPNGFLLLEVGYDQSLVVGKMMAPFFSNLETISDLSGIPRVVFGTRQ